MLIPLVSASPKEVANYLLTHTSPGFLRKIATEILQCGCAVMSRLLSEPPSYFYVSTKSIQNHPAAKWMGKNSGNFEWAIQTAYELFMTWRPLAKKETPEASQRAIHLMQYLYLFSVYLPNGKFTPELLIVGYNGWDVFEAYQHYLSRDVRTARLNARKSKNASKVPRSAKSPTRSPRAAVAQKRVVAARYSTSPRLP